MSRFVTRPLMKSAVRTAWALIVFACVESTTLNAEFPITLGRLLNSVGSTTFAADQASCTDDGDGGDGGTGGDSCTYYYTGYDYSYSADDGGGDDIYLPGMSC
jgi:hypothetical protein